MSLHACVPAALAQLAPDLHGGSLVLLDAGSAEAIACGAGLKLLTDMGAVSVGDLGSPSLPRDVAAAAALAGGRLSALVLFVSSPLAPAEAPVLAACRAAMAVTARVVVACAVSEAAHHDEAPALYSPTCYADFCAALRRQLQPTRRLDVAAKACPLLIVPLGDAAFVLPAGCAAAAAAAVASGRPLGYVPAVRAAAEEDDDEGDGGGAAAAAGPLPDKAHGVAALAHALAAVAAGLGVRPEAFCLGPAAVAVGRSLSFVASSDAAPAAFILVDRAADLASPLRHADVMMQRSWDLLRSAAEERGGDGGWDGGAVAAAPSFARFCAAHVPVPLPGADEFLPGALFHPQDAETTSHLGFLLSRPGKDAAMFVRKWLREAARKEGLSAAALPRSRPGAAGAAELRALAAAVAGASPGAAARAAPLLQLAEAAAVALEETPSVAWDLLNREERALAAAAVDGADPLCEQLADLLASAARGGPIGLLQVVGMLIAAYQILPDHLPWFAGGGGGGGSGGGGGGPVAPFSGEHEARLRSGLVDAVLACAGRWAAAAEPAAAAQREAPWLPPPLLARLVAAAGGEDAGARRAVHLEVRNATNHLFARLRELSAIREAAQRGGGGGGGAAEGPAPPLLVRLAAAVADRREVAELKHASTSLAGLLKSGLGRFGLQRQPRPGDYPLVVIFVIGGISVSEIHEVLACVDARAAAAQAAAAQAAAAAGGGGAPGEGTAGPPAPARVLVGGTALLQPRDVVQHAVGVF